MSLFNEVMDRLSQLWVPGVEKFYERFEVDPWAKADAELETAVVGKEQESQKLSICVYEAKKKKLLALYKEFLDVQRLQAASHPFLEEFYKATIALARDSVLCDDCKRSVSQARQMLMRVEVVELEGDLRKVIIAVCDSCGRGKM